VRCVAGQIQALEHLRLQQRLPHTGVTVVTDDSDK